MPRRETQQQKNSRSMKGRLFLLVREGGLALRCGAGRLGLQASPGGLLSALGFKSPGYKKKNDRP